MGVAPIPANNRTRVLPFVVTAANTNEPIVAPENGNEAEEDVLVVTNVEQLNLGGGRRRRKTRKRRLISKK